MPVLPTWNRAVALQSKEGANLMIGVSCIAQDQVPAKNRASLNASRQFLEHVLDVCHHDLGLAAAADESLPSQFVINLPSHAHFSFQGV